MQLYGILPLVSVQFHPYENLQKNNRRTKPSYFNQSQKPNNLKG